MFSFTEFHEAIKFKNLIAHFSEHKKINQNISFLDFIEQHYTNNEHTSSHHANDDNLPLKNIDCLSVVSHFTPIDYPIWQKKHFYSLKIKNNVFDEFFISQNLKNSIWQPPKFI